MEEAAFSPDKKPAAKPAFEATSSEEKQPEAASTGSVPSPDEQEPAETCTYNPLLDIAQNLELLGNLERMEAYCDALGYAQTKHQLVVEAREFIMPHIRALRIERDQKKAASETKTSPKRPETTDEDCLPEVFSSPRALRLFSALQDIGVLDKDFQPVDLSWTQRGYLAQAIIHELNISAGWAAMARLWNCFSETLRSSYNKALDVTRISDFEERIHAAIKTSL